MGTPWAVTSPPPTKVPPESPAGPPWAYPRRMSDPIKRAEDVAEQRIREAMEAGAFDDLPGQGRPLPDDGRIHDPGWWARRYMSRFRDEETRQDRVRELAVRVDRCWVLAEGEALAALATITTEWEALVAADPTLPAPPTKGEFLAMWKRMHRAR